MSLKFLIAAAGKGSRSGLDFPKTLFPVEGIPIINRLYDALDGLDNNPIIVVSKETIEPISTHLNSCDLKYELVLQSSLRGMAHAVSMAANFEKLLEFDHLGIVWCDIPFLSKKTVNTLYGKHLLSGSDLSIASIKSSNPYTQIIRNKDNNVLRVNENKGINSNKLPKEVERDIGLFILKISSVFPLLLQYIDSFNDNKDSKEISFLKFIEKIVNKELKVEAFPIANPKEELSLNTVLDQELILNQA